MLQFSTLWREQLRKRGCEVRLYSEEQFIAEGVEERIVLNMCRGETPRFHCCRKSRTTVLW